MPTTPDGIAQDAAVLRVGLSRGVKEQLLALWGALPSHHGDQIPFWLRHSIPLVLGAQRATADISAGYLAAQFDLIGLDIPRFPPYRVTTGSAIRNGVPPAEVYKRPFVDVWTGLKNGHDLDQSLDLGRDRLVELVDTDLQLAHDHTVRDMLSRSTSTGYRRVLVGTTNCALCIVASTQLYHRAQLMPIHPHCNCAVEPASDERPLDTGLLERLHAEIAARFGISDRSARAIDYRKISITREHGEYGPTLTYSHDRFTGPDDLTTPARRTR